MAPDSTTLAMALDKEVVAPALAIGGSFLLAFVWIVARSITKVVKTRHMEESRREIAAYVAEGSITPEQGERLLRADRPHWERRND